ncbi:hypothetical protein RJ640_004671 [Escallonia rubra]|uniref:Uncharacterized protein n=1 Tax=Escallonia rubra TaxID=112253 RepID=A0AA88RKY9_9ASTE|nr:hypothetical protein RJ640_004671 [Escallonia rubra]
MGYGPTTLPLRHSDLLISINNSQVSILGPVGYGSTTLPLRYYDLARFRSWDLWVMGPPRFRCATLIC